MTDEQFAVFAAWLSVIANRLKIIMLTLSVLTGVTIGFGVGTAVGEAFLR